MEDLRKAAKYYLETASEEYKQRAGRAMAAGELVEDFYVRETMRCIRSCNVCAKLVVGFYFCCTKCELYKGCNYNLCVECFYGGTFQHNHDTFADNHSVMMMLNEQRSEPTCVIEKNNGKGKQNSTSIGDVSSSHSKSIPSHSNLKDSGSHFNSSLKDSGLTHSSSSKLIISNPNLRESSHFMPTDNVSARKLKIKIDENGIKRLAQIADAHYNASPENIRHSADMFFWNMVKQKGKTRVTMEDFLKSMKEMRYPEYAYPELFEMVVKDRKEGMELMESRTVYYIVVSGRPFCSWCNYFIPDIYFCCSKCSARSYALCLHCYSNKAYLMHRHYKDDDAFFLDYTVLHNTIKATSEPRESESSSTAIAKRNPRKDDKVTTVLKVGQAILNVGAAVLTIASTLGACTIM